MRKPLQRIAALFPQFAHFRPRGEADFNRPQQLGSVIGMNLRSGRWVEAAQDPMQVACSLLFCALTQPLAQFLGTLRAGKQAFQQRAQIQASPSDHDRQSSPRLDLLQHLAGLAGVFAGGDVAGRIHKIEQMMRDAGALGSRGFRGSNLKLAIHGDRIAVHDFAVKAFSQRQRKCSLTASRRTEHHNQQGLGRRGQRAPQAM